MNLIDGRDNPSRRPAAAAGSAPAGRYGVVLTILVVGGIIYTGAQAIMLSTIGFVARGVHASPTSTTWVLTAFILSGGVATPIVGRLGDMFGKKRALVLMLVVVIAGFVVCGLATSLPVMIFGRVLAGVSSGVFPLGFGIIRDEFPKDRVAGAVGVMSISVGLGTASGVLLAGVIAANLSYHWLFWFPLVLAGPTCVAAAIWIPESPVRPGGSIDWPGAGLVVVGLVCVLLAITESTTWGWGSPKTLGLLAGGVVVVGIWVVFERRRRAPLIDMQTMAIPTVWRTNLASALSGMTMFASFAIIPRFVQQPIRGGFGFGASVSGAGIYLLPSTLTMVACGLMAGRIDRWIGSRIGLILGCLTGGAGFVLIALVDRDPWAIYVGMGLVGVGVGVAYAALPNLIIAAVPQDQTGAAMAINTIVRAVGGALGVQVCTTFIAQDVGLHGLPAVGGFLIGFWICAGGLLGAAAVALIIPSRRRSAAVPLLAAAAAPTPAEPIGRA
jgi:MFS family permease